MPYKDSFIFMANGGDKPKVKLLRLCVCKSSCDLTILSVMYQLNEDTTTNIKTKRLNSRYE